MICARTVTASEFPKIQEQGPPSNPVPITENWLYRTRMQPSQKNPTNGVFDSSDDGPDWFKIKENQLVKDHDIQKSQGFDGTLTILSRISGWITVSPKSRNRSKRLGRYGPFDKSKKGNNYQNVSDLAPAWMQTEFQRKESTDFKNFIAPCNLRKEQKRVFLVENQKPVKSVFSYGDFRHNVNTSEEILRHSQGLSYEPKRFIEWKEDLNRQKYDKPVTQKIGSPLPHY